MRKADWHLLPPLAICSCTKSVSSNHLGNRMFYLDAGVHLQEVEPSFVLVENKLNGACVFVPDGVRNPQGRLAQPFPEGRLDSPGAGASSISFLVAPLYRAVPLEQVDAVSVTVSQNLHFDMAGVGDEGLQVQPVVAKGRPGLRGSLPIDGLQVVRLVDRFHALAAASRRRLQENRVSNIFRHGRSLGEFVDQSRNRALPESPGRQQPAVPPACLPSS